MNISRMFKRLDMEPSFYIKKYAIPLVFFGILTSVLIYLIVPWLFTGPFISILILIPIICTIIVFSYPIYIVNAQKTRINNNMHYYITQMGAVATANTPRIDVIRIVSKNEDFQDLAEENREIYNLVSVWNLNLGDACKFVSKRTPSVIFEDFLDRFAHALHSGENVNEFLSTEQNVVMNEYESMYYSSLYMIDVIKELFVSLVISMIFLASFAVITPILTGMSAVVLMAVVVIVFIATDVFVLLFTRSVVPDDPLWQQKQSYTEDITRIYRTIPISVAGCLFMTLIILLYDGLPMPISIALALTPLVYTGYVTKKIETTIQRKDENFPAFIRSLGSSAGAKGNMIDDALKSLRLHDFGPLTNDVNELYKRLILRINKIKSWYWFAASTGSNLIQHFCSMFVEATNLGGKPDTIGNIIATNFHRMVTLRKKRYQTASSFVGVLYGLTAGIGFTLNISVGVVEIMQDMFYGIDMPSNMSMSMILHTNIGDLGLLTMLVMVIMVAHSLISALLIRVIDGGSFLRASTDFVIMVWISGLVAVVTDIGVESLLQF
ncbi:Type II secretion system F domain protein [Methanohalobium evestigatum Z-7303]|uniref:Type II secretion system F domain protein n=1 Tax=Methanohalobium evestigatum (strain ATCC BAA-1072 / DSM 3721 / NBRC 107634 / OCM 161 / Z-7303) TaxID=644295 RepID=D7E7V2_METEZ|nr:archaellar assembly protein FlaJ [Methanohalobium evestigatum]ADI74175.1 Type II secretion system F domain protein [Methanohalobium evestigatum Z-7303]